MSGEGGQDRVRGMKDVTACFLAACAALPAGQLVQADGLPLLEAMNSLTLLDPRMDSGADPVQPEDRGETWDPAASVSVEEACAIMDKLLALEMTYHQGVPLVSSLFISKHVLNIDRLPPVERAAVVPPSSDLPNIALRCYVYMFYLTNHLAWHEMVRGNVYDGEDWMSDTCGLWESGGEWPLGIMTVHDMADMHEQVVEWVEHSDIEEEWQRHLLSRLRFRWSLLCYLVDDVSGKYSPIPQLPPLEDDLRSLETLPALSPSAAASPRVRAAFDDKIQRRMRQAMPLAPVDIGNWKETLARCRVMVQGLILAGDLGRCDSMTVWKESLHIAELADPPYHALIRSLLMSSLSPTNDVLFLHPQFHTSAAAHQFLQDECDQRPQVLRYLRQKAQDGGEVAVARALATFEAVLSGNLISDLHMMCTSRSRQRRYLLKCTARWTELYQILPPPGTIPQDVLGPIRRAYLRNRSLLMLSGLLAGFDTDLIDRSEWLATWWVISGVCQDALRRTTPDDPPAHTSVVFAWSAVARAMLLAIPAAPLACTKAARGLPARLAPAQFDIRFKWARAVPSRLTEKERGDFFTPTFKQSLQVEKELKDLPRLESMTQSAEAFDAAAGDFQESFAEVLVDLPAVIGEQRMLMYQDLIKACRSNAVFIRSLLARANGQADKVPSLTWRARSPEGGRWRAWIPLLERGD